MSMAMLFCMSMVMLFFMFIPAIVITIIMSDDYLVISSAFVGSIPFPEHISMEIWSWLINHHLIARVKIVMTIGHRQRGCKNPTTI